MASLLMDLVLPGSGEIYLLYKAMDAVAKNAQKEQYLKSIIELVATYSEEGADFLTKFDESLKEAKDNMKCVILTLEEGILWSDGTNAEDTPADSVRKAWYGSPDDEKARSEVTEAVKERLQAGEEVSASNDLFGDPAPGVGKVLKIYRDKPGEESSQETKSDGAHKVLAMKTAKKMYEKYLDEGVGEIKQWAIDEVKGCLTETAGELFGEEFSEEGLEGMLDICEEFGSEFGADSLGELAELFL